MGSIGEKQKMSYKINPTEKINPKNCVLIEGLPGIGNVGKIAVDFIIDSIKAKKVYEVHSNKFPHAVFVNEKNLIELPSIDIYHKKVKDQDILLLSGDIQPIDETSCHEFCHRLLDLVESLGCKEIVTLGGIGLHKVPKNPKVYCTANESAIIKEYKSKILNNNIHGVVGPIIGVTGLLVGLAKKRNIPSIALLAETFGHQNYIGLKGAKEIVKILKDKFDLKLNINKLDNEIVDIEKELIDKTKKIRQIQKGQKKQKEGKDKETDYIG